MLQKYILLNFLLKNPRGKKIIVSNILNRTTVFNINNDKNNILIENSCKFQV